MVYATGSDWPAAPPHSPVLVARLVPVDVALFQDDVLASFDQTQVVRLGAREVIQRHHHQLLLLLLIIIVVVVTVIVVIIILIDRREWRRKSLPLEKKEE